MHNEVGTSNVPAFLTKLWKLVEDPNYDHLISWGPNDKSFIIRDQSRFAKELLPLYFKHNNMASFIRQLNMYGFRKITNIENSGLRLDNDEIEFYHAYFLKGQENLLEYIKRKVRSETSHSLVNSKTSSPDEKIKKEEVKSILLDMKGIKGKQDSIDSFLVNLQRENEALWREVALLRQKHQKQQQIVEKLIQFFLTLVHNRGLGLKRNFPLMIDSQNGARNQLRVNLVPTQASGPVIHDVTDHVLDDESFLAVSGSNSSNSNSASSGNGKASNALIEENSKSPFSTGEIIDNDIKATANVPLDPLELAFEDVQNETNEPIVDNIPLTDQLEQLSSVKADDLLQMEPPVTDQTNLIEGQLVNIPNEMGKPAFSDPLQLESFTNPSNTVSKPTSSAVNTSLVPSTSSVLNTPTYTIENIDDQLEGIDTELSWLQEQLSLGGYNIDSNTLMGLFTSEDESLNNSRQLTGNETTGNEMIQYVPRALPTSVTTSVPDKLTTSVSTMAPSMDMSAKIKNMDTNNASISLQPNSTCNLQPGRSVASSHTTKHPYSSLVSNNEAAAALYDSAPNATGNSFGTSATVDLLGGELDSASLSTKDDLDKQLEQLEQSNLFDAGELLNSESDIDKILDAKAFASDKKRRKIA